MPKRKTLLLFDVDGTLTKPRQVITEDLKKFLFERVQPLADVGLVGGSDYQKINEQMGGEHVTNKLEYVFSENGLMQFKGGKLVSSQSIVKHFGEQTLQRVINFALGYMSQIQLPAKRGTFVELRTSMINLCPVGRSCSQAERDQFAAYDAEHNVRKKFVAAMQEEFKELKVQFALGGQISVDVFPVGWDKTYCLNHIADKGYEVVHFFGDKTDPGGNDHEIYNHEDTIGHSVTSPEDTKEQLIQLLNLKL